MLSNQTPKLEGKKRFLPSFPAVMVGVFAVTHLGCQRKTENSSGTRHEMNLSSRAVASPTYPGMIKKSEVVMRGLHPRHDTLEAIHQAK